MNKDVVWNKILLNGILLSHQKEQNLAICNNMDGTGVYYTKQNKLEKEKYHMIWLM